MLSLLSVSSRKESNTIFGILLFLMKEVLKLEKILLEKINEYKPYLLSKYPELLDISNQNNSKLFQQKLSKLSHLPLFKPRMPYYDSKGDVVLEDTDTVEGRVIEKIDKIIANTSQKEQVIGRFCCLSHINSLGQQVNYDIHLKNKLVEDVFYLSGYHSDLVNSNISYNLLEDIKKAEETVWINKNKLFSKTGSDTLYIENNKEIPLREYLSYMKENFTETIQHNGNQCTLTNFSIKNNIFLNYCTEKDIFGLPRIFITYQDNDIDLVYNIKKSLDKHRQQSY